MQEARTDNGAALVYCRVSTKRLAEGTSLASQAARCTAHAEKLGYAVTRVTQEVHSGAELFERAALARDRIDIRAGAYKALVAYSVDRLTRDEAHLAILRAECDRAGCRLIFVTDGDELPREAYAAESERRKVVERTCRGRHSKLLQGRPAFNGWALYGYRPDREAGVYRVHEPEAAVVRRAFTMCSEGHGMHRIASAFNREGIPSPKSDIRPGARWTSATVSLLLNNRSYMGEEVCWKTKKTAAGRDLPRPESEQVRLPDGVRPPIVPRELWEECQRLIAARAAKMKNTGEYPALLRGHLFCGECGARMVRNHFRRGKYEYLKYRCGSRWRPFDTGCKGEAVPLAVAEEWAWGLIYPLLPDLPAASRAAEASPPRPSEDLEAARQAHARATRTLEALLGAAGGSEALRQYVEQARREKLGLERVITELEERDGSPHCRMADLLRLCERAKEGAGRLTFDERRRTLDALGFKAYANGDDPDRWRYEVTLLASDGKT